MNLEKELYSEVTDGVARARRTAWEEGLRQAGYTEPFDLYKPRLSFQYLPDGASMLWLDKKVPVCYVGPLDLKAFPTRVTFPVAYAREAESAFYLQSLTHLPQKCPPLAPWHQYAHKTPKIIARNHENPF